MLVGCTSHANTMSDRYQQQAIPQRKRDRHQSHQRAAAGIPAQSRIRHGGRRYREQYGGDEGRAFAKRAAQQRVGEPNREHAEQHLGSSQDGRRWFEDQREREQRSRMERIQRVADASAQKWRAARQPLLDVDAVPRFIAVDARPAADQDRPREDCRTQRDDQRDRRVAPRLTAAAHRPGRAPRVRRRRQTRTSVAAR